MFWVLNLFITNFKHFDQDTKESDKTGIVETTDKIPVDKEPESSYPWRSPSKTTEV